MLKYKQLQKFGSMQDSVKLSVGDAAFRDLKRQIRVVAGPQVTDSTRKV